MSSTSTSLPASADTELALSVERAYREVIVIDRLGAIWSVILAKCLLAQWAINEFSIPVSGLRYIWLLTLSMAVVATGLYLRAHQSKINFLPNQLRVGTAIFLGNYCGSTDLYIVWCVVTRSGRPAQCLSPFGGCVDLVDSGWLRTR